MNIILIAMNYLCQNIKHILDAKKHKLIKIKNKCKGSIIYCNMESKNYQNNNECDVLFINNNICNTARVLGTGAFSGWKIGSGTQMYVGRYNIKRMSRFITFL